MSAFRRACAAEPRPNLRTIDEVRAATLASLVTMVDNIDTSNVIDDFLTAGFSTASPSEPSEALLQILEILEGKGLVSRTAPGSEDETPDILLTEAGSDLLQRARDHQEATLAAAIARIPEPALRQLLDSLERAAARRAAGN